MTETEIEILRRLYSRLEWQADPEPHRYRALDADKDMWMLAKFSTDSAAWALMPVAPEFLGDDAARAEEFATKKLDQHLERLRAGQEQK